MVNRPRRLEAFQTQRAKVVVNGRVVRGQRQRLFVVGTRIVEGAGFELKVRQIAQRVHARRRDGQYLAIGRHGGSRVARPALRSADLEPAIGAVVTQGHRPLEALDGLFVSAEFPCHQAAQIPYPGIAGVGFARKRYMSSARSSLPLR